MVWRGMACCYIYIGSTVIEFPRPLLGFNIHAKPLKFQLYPSDCIYIKFDSHYFYFYLFWFWCFLKKIFFNFIRIVFILSLILIILKKKNSNFIPQYFISFNFCVKLSLHSFDYYFLSFTFFFSFVLQHFILFAISVLIFLLLFCLSFSSFILFFNLIPHYFISMIFYIRICPHCLDFYFFMIENFASLSFVVCHIQGNPGLITQSTNFKYQLVLSLVFF
jgi:hypothetical protein